MEKKDKFFVLALVGGILAILCGMAVAAHLSSENESDDNPNSMPSKDSSPNSFRCTSNSYPLKYGVCHKDVRILQKHLKKLGADLGKTGPNKDGIEGQFGERTLTASKKYLDKESFTTQDIQNINTI